MRVTRTAALLVLLLACCIEPRTAHAYLDPGTGGMLLSGILSLFVTLWLGIQAYGYKVLGYLRRATGRAAPDPDALPPQHALPPQRDGGGDRA